MSLDTSSIQSFTDADLLSLARAALAGILAGGQSYSLPGGRSFTRANMNDLLKLINELEGRINAATEDSGIALVRFGEAR